MSGLRNGFGILLAVLLASRAFAATDVPPEPPINSAPCMAAIAALDDDKIMAACGEVIDGKTTPRADRLKALVARGAAFARKEQPDRAIADYDVALRLDPTQAAVFNARGELWRQKGERPRAIGDFAAALRLDPQNETARANHKALALEIERLGADMALKHAPGQAAKPPLK